MNVKTPPNPNRPAMTDPILRIDEVAQILRCSERAVAERIKRKEIKGYKKLNRWYTLQSEVINYIKS
jgi:predicted DNA-binding transcriptional regulator AlpA